MSQVPRLENDLEFTRVSVQQWIDSGASEDGSLPDSLKELGVQSVTFEQWNAQASVFMQPGADGQPGVAGVDDNGSGIVDDESELGATRSDDVLSVTADAVPTDGPTLVLQSGAFVPVTYENALADDQPWRAVVQGDGWSFIIR
ncbi:MAG: hypothetical protein AAGI63_06290 [Planctomycetota bacterium]